MFTQHALRTDGQSTLSDEQLSSLSRLADLPDSEIDTSDAPPMGIDAIWRRADDPVWLALHSKQKLKLRGEAFAQEVSELFKKIQRDVGEIRCLMTALEGKMLETKVAIRERHQQAEILRQSIEGMERSERRL